MTARNVADLLDGHVQAFLARAAKWVTAGEPWPAIATAAKQDGAVGAGRVLGSWLAEDIALQGAAQGAAQAGELRARAMQTERALQEAVAAAAKHLGGLGEASKAAEAAESLTELLGAEADQIVDAVQNGFIKASGAPLVALRRGLTLEDARPEGPKGDRIRFDKPVAPPPGLALEPLAHFRQDVARLKHYAMRDAVGRTFRPTSVAGSSSYFKVIRPPVSHEGDLGEFKALSGLANAADAWADEVRAAMLWGFEDRLKARSSLPLMGTASEVGAVLRALEIERCVADLNGALAREPESAAIPAEGLLALVIAAPLPTGGLTR